MEKFTVLTGVAAPIPMPNISTDLIAPSFGAIFHDNSFQNGLLPLKVPMEDIERLTQGLARTNASELTVDLEKRELQVSGMAPVTFDLPDNRRLPLMEGMDQLGFMLRSVHDIAAFEDRVNTERPWAYPSAG